MIKKATFLLATMAASQTAFAVLPVGIEVDLQSKWAKQILKGYEIEHGKILNANILHDITYCDPDSTGSWRLVYLSKQELSDLSAGKDFERPRPNPKPVKIMDSDPSCSPS